MYLELLAVTVAAGLLFYLRRKDENALEAELPVLKTDRLILRPWKRSDAEDMYEFSKDPRVGPQAGWQPHKTMEESVVRIQSYIEGRHVFAIELAGEAKVIGSIGIYNRKPTTQYSKKLDQRAIGFVLNPDYWGKGYMTESLNAIVGYSFNELGIDILWCGHFPENDRSRKVIERCGFKYELDAPVLLKDLDNRPAELKYYSKKNHKK